MTEDNVVKLPDPPKSPEWIVGPFEEYRVVIHGRMIPDLTALRLKGGGVMLSLDHRFLIEIPDEGLAYQVAAFVANALAIGSGYPFSGAETKERPFAPKAIAISNPNDIVP